MKTDKHLRKHLKDYQPPEFGISKTHLEFHLDARGSNSSCLSCASMAGC